MPRLTWLLLALGACAPTGDAPSLEEPASVAPAEAASEEARPKSGETPARDAVGQLLQHPGTWSLGKLTLTIELRYEARELEDAAQAAIRLEPTLVAQLQHPLDEGGFGSSLVFKDTDQGWFVFAEDPSRIWGYDGNEVLGRLTESGGGFELKYLTLDQDWAVDGVPIPMEVVERMPQPIRDLSGH
ncbi:MAG: hypothetical protein ISQ08_03035 [Planctomycetes bacterium]|nr:hypothetical protein [Planctomycetota bacterium]